MPQPQRHRHRHRILIQICQSCPAPRVLRATRGLTVWKREVWLAGFAVDGAARVRDHESEYVAGAGLQFLEFGRRGLYGLLGLHNPAFVVAGAERLERRIRLRPCKSNRQRLRVGGGDAGEDIDWRGVECSLHRIVGVIYVPAKRGWMDLTAVRANGPAGTHVKKLVGGFSIDRRLCRLWGCGAVPQRGMCTPRVRKEPARLQSWGLRGPAGGTTVIPGPPSWSATASAREI